VTCNAVRIVATFTRNYAQRVRRQAGQRPHVLSNVGSLGGANGAGPRRHDTVATMGDGMLNLLWATAIQPIPVSQVGKRRRAARIGSVTLGTVIQEQALTDLSRLVVAGDLRDRHVLVARIHGRNFLGV